MVTEARKKQLREAQAKWREKNPDYYKKWLKKGDNAKKHNDYMKAYMKGYYQAHKDEWWKYGN